MRPGRRNALLFGGVAALAALGGGLVGALLVQSGSGAAALLSASFVDLSGRKRRLLDWQGRALVCNFWATWCAPCREEVPLLVAAKQQHASARLEIVGIAIDQAAKIAEFAEKYDINYPILVADAGAIELMRGLGNRSGGLPFTVVLDQAGAVVERKLGAFRREELQAALARVLG